MFASVAGIRPHAEFSQGFVDCNQSLTSYNDMPPPDTTLPPHRGLDFIHAVGVWHHQRNPRRVRLGPVTGQTRNFRIGHDTPGVA
jgi:hypothetical protein